jgi:hypothetical protein
MITKLNATGTWWSSDLYEGNAAFVDTGSAIFVVSQVRQGTSPPVGNTFAVLMSNPVPPDPGPGWSFTEVAAYEFPEPNSSFDPVAAYDGSQYIHIIGTQDNPLGGVDLLKFTFDTIASSLSGPTVLATASAVREGYDVTPLASGGSFVAASVVSPTAVGSVSNSVLVTSISISSNVLTVGTDYGSPPAGDILQPGMDITFSSLRLATFLNRQTVTVGTSSPSSFTASFVHPDYSQPEPLTASVLGIGIFQNEMTVETDTDLAAAGWQPWWIASFSGLANATFLNGLAVNINSVGTLGNFVGTAANSLQAEFEYPSGSPPDDYCTDVASPWDITLAYSSGDLAWNQGYLWRSLHDGNLGNFPLPGFWWENSPLHPVPDSGTITGGALGESGYAIWLPGNSLLGFELTGSDTLVSLPTVLASSPSRSGPVYGSASVCLGSSGALEVYFESHPKDVSFKDQAFAVSETDSLSTSSPYDSWGSPAVLTTFMGRYADNRLTVVPSGEARTACLVYFTQDPQRSILTGNILLGYLSPSPPSPWAWQASLGPVLGGSVTQAVLSFSETQGASVSYLLSPAYNKRGAWSYSDLTIPPYWQDSYAVNDQVSYQGQGFTCILPLSSRGWWAPQNSYYGGDIAAVAAYYSANSNITGAAGALPPPEDPADWSSQGAGATPPPPTAVAWSPGASYAQGTTVYVPAYYLYGGTGVLSSSAEPPQDPAHWAPLSPPPLDTEHWGESPVSWPLMTGGLDYSALGILDPQPYGGLSLTWLRGTKSVLDDSSLWAVVGEADTGDAGSPPSSTDTYYASHFDVPPEVYLQPSGGMVYRDMPFLLDASQTYEASGNPIGFTWSLVPSNPNISLTPIGQGDQAILLVQRAIGGAETPVSVAVVADDYDDSTSPPTPVHPPMMVSQVAYDDVSNTATLQVDSIATVATGEEVLAYGLADAAFLNNAVITVGGTSSSPPSFYGTVSFAVPGLQPAFPYGPLSDTGYAAVPPQYAVIQSSLSPASGLLIAYNAPPAITMPDITSAARNTSVMLAPVITGATDVDDDTTYSWAQLQGTTVQATGADSPVLAFETNGVSVEGESLEWGLTVDDGVNPSATAGITISVPSYFDWTPPIPGDSLQLSRSGWPTNISERNGLPHSPPALLQSSLALGSESGGLSISLPSPATPGSLLLLIDIGSDISAPDEPYLVPTGFGQLGISRNMSGGAALTNIVVWTRMAQAGDGTTFTAPPIGSKNYHIPFVLLEIGGVWGTPSVVFGNMSGTGTSVPGITGGAVVMVDAATASGGTATPSFYSLLHTFQATTWGMDCFYGEGTVPQQPIADSNAPSGIPYAIVTVPASELYWGPLDVSYIYSDLAWAKRASVLQTLSPPAYGNDRYVVISPYSALVYMPGQPYALLRRLLPPAPNSSPPVPPPTVLDAVHTEADYTLVLSSSGLLYRFSSAPLLNTDNPDTTIDLSALSELSFTRISSTISFAGTRVLALSGPQGCLLLQVDSATLEPQAMLEITTESRLLYGADSVQFVRLANVESLRTGQAFLGTVDTNGYTYETLIDLSQGRIIGTWDRSQLVNQHVASGEVLFQAAPSYSGQPTAPVLSPIVNKGPNPLQPNLELVAVSWAQVRPDLCSGYVVEVSLDGGATWPSAYTVGSGSIESLTISLARGSTVPIGYTFRVQAGSEDGTSGFSNTESILL